MKKIGFYIQKNRFLKMCRIHTPGELADNRQHYYCLEDKKDVCRTHIVQEETYLYDGSDKLHEDIIINMAVHEKSLRICF